MKKNLFFYNSFIYIIFINFLFFLLTLDIQFYSDDFQSIIGVKLFNLINNNNFSFLEFFAIRPDGHFVPFFYIINQFLPSNVILLHLFIITCFTLSSLLIIFIVKTLTDNMVVACCSGILFSINYSISIKPLMWNVFHSHITNSLTGFLGILIYILYLKNKINPLFVILYFPIMFITVLNSESGLIYPLILYLIYIMFFEFKKNFILNSFIILSPNAFYLLSVQILSGNFLPLLTNRINNNIYPNNYNDYNFYEKINFLRSREAPKDYISLLIRSVDLFLASINLSSLENVIKYFFYNIKELIINKINIFIFFVVLIFSFISIYFYKIKDFLKNKNVKKFSILYFCVFLIYLLIFNRFDICIGLAFPSAVIISYAIEYCYKKYQYTFFLIIFMFSAPSILYGITKFEFVYEMLPRKNIIEINQVFNENLDEIPFNKSIPYASDFIYYYYYKNYDLNKNYLKKYKGMQFYKFEGVLSKQL
tara:strand:+ start:9239 stop:10675 length:1437 start_codon:yes stop_codon:yes gene_type:complete